MALGVAGHAYAREAMRLDQSAGANIARRFERPLGGRDITRNQEDAPDIGFAAQPRQEVFERKL